MLLVVTRCLSSIRPSIVNFSCFNVCSENTEWNLTKLDMKQELNIPYQVWVFSVDRKIKMSSDWLRHVNCCREFELVSCVQGVSLLCWKCYIPLQLIFLLYWSRPASSVSSVRHEECVTWTFTHVRNWSRWLTAGTCII